MSLFSYAIDDDPSARGAQGAVFFGRRGDGLPVAVKVAGDDARAQAALDHEIALLRAMDRAGVPGVMPCLDRISVRGRPGMVMPRFEQTLGDWLDRVTTRPDAGTLSEVLDVAQRLARTLGAVHRVRLSDGFVVHRDIKPENIFIDADGDLYLGDFGGAMAIDGLKAVELALFGTPMWAPFDQILPGRAVPDPTWDTYALCVLLYAALTKARPAYQADPRELLTSRGRELWQVAARAIHAQGDHARTLRQSFADARRGTSTEDLVDLTGRSALNEADRRALKDAVDRLGRLAGVDDRVRSALERALWSVLSRGLSPVSHPSPPNRYRDGAELAATLADLAEIVARPATVDPEPERVLGGPMSAVPDVFIDGPDADPEPTSRAGWIGLALAGVGIGLAATAAWLAWTVVPTALSATVPLTEAVRLDRTEVTGARWAQVTGHTRGEPELPVVGLTYAEAAAFCAAAGGRLPTDAEWTAAAGDEVWPWGQESPTCDHANAMGCGGTLRPPGGRATASGMVDLAGNAEEWVAEGMVRGGSATSPASGIGKRGTRTPPPDAAPTLAGARCAYDAAD